MKKLYVGNLAWAVTDEDLQSLFSEYGSVASAAVITDRETGRSRGFGFVELEDGADAAIEALNGQDYKGRALRVNGSKQRAFWWRTPRRRADAFKRCLAASS